eukprot:2288154-Rhodomonas_salina.1
MVLSSYAPIQITRIRPYGRSGASLDSASVALQGNLLDIFQVNGGVNCSARFHVAITQLEYVDALNVAVTVAETTLRGARRLAEDT